MTKLGALGDEAESGLAIPRSALDGIDRKILSILQENARLSNIEIAKRVGLSPPPVLRRTQTLRKKGYIKNYRATLDARKLGFEICAFVFVGLRSQAQTDLAAFEKLVESWTNVSECYALTGEIDFLLKCVAKDLTSFQNFVRFELMPAPNIESIKSALAIHASKEFSPIPLEAEY